MENEINQNQTVNFKMNSRFKKFTDEKRINIKGVKAHAGLCGGIIVERLVYLCSKYKYSENKITKEIAYFTGEKFSVGNIGNWKRNKERRVRTSKIKQLEKYFKKKGLALLDKSYDEFVESANLSEHKEENLASHPHTESIESFDEIEPVSPYNNENDSFKEDFKKALNMLLDLCDDDFQSSFGNHNKMTVVFECAKRIRELDK